MTTIHKYINFSKYTEIELGLKGSQWNSPKVVQFLCFLNVSPIEFSKSVVIA